MNAITNHALEQHSSTKWTTLQRKREGRERVQVNLFYCSVLWYMYLLCPTKDHVVVDLDIKLVTSSAKMVQHCLSIIYLDTDSSFHYVTCTKIVAVCHW